MHSEHLRWLTRAVGPFASVYFDDSHDAADSAGQLDAKWRDIRAQLADRAPAPAFSTGCRKRSCTTSPP